MTTRPQEYLEVLSLATVYELSNLKAILAMDDSKYQKQELCFCETKHLRPQNSHFLRNVTSILDLDLGT